MRNEGGLPDSLSRSWRQHVGAQINGSDDEQHDAHVKCYRIAVAVADSDTVEAAYGKHLEKAGSTDELRRMMAAIEKGPMPSARPKAAVRRAIQKMMDEVKTRRRAPLLPGDGADGATVK
jgi:hypothetical protein